MLTKQQIRYVVQKYEGGEENILAILLELQESSGQNYISEDCAEEVAKELNIPVSKVYDLLTFHSMFSTKPRGKYIIEICKSAPCHVNRSRETVKMFENELGIKMGETTSDKLFTLQYTSCIGACDIAPAVKIGEKVYGNLTEEDVKKIIQEYRGEGK